MRGLYDDETQMSGMPEAPSPKLFVNGLSLRRYQKQALAWMIQREKRRYVTEEDCTGLALGDTCSKDRGGVGSPSPPGGGATAESSAGESSGDCLVVKANGGGAGGGGGGGVEGGGADDVVVRDGRVYVSSWEFAAAKGGNCGGGAGVTVHPLWERRAAAFLTRTVSAKPSCFLGDGFGGEGGSEDGAEGEGGGVGVLSEPEAFYVNVYSRRFQREIPPASLGCQGGILADEMGMGKVRHGEGGRGRGGVDALRKGDGGEEVWMFCYC